jgi:hypothetical protein
MLNFLGFLRKEKNLQSETLAGYRSTISSTIASLRGRPSTQLTESLLLRDWLKGLKNEAANNSSVPRVPQWDVYRVLKLLSSKEFEPIDSISFKFLTYKTVFLVALAIARRVSGLHGLGGRKGDIATLPTGGLRVDFLPEFRAKNDPSGRSPAVPSVEVKSLSGVVDPEDTDRFLCPVRALRCYLKRSLEFRSPITRRLFVSLHPKHVGDISKQTIARWIKAVVILAYQRDSLVPPERIKAHETRAIATSLADARGVPLETLMAAAYWRTQNTFLSYYLRDVSSHRLDGAYDFKSLVLANFVTQQ